MNLMIAVIAASSLLGPPGYLKSFVNGYGQTVTAVAEPGKPVCRKPIAQCHPTLVRDGVRHTWNSQRARHHYSSSPTWNADGTLMFLDRGSSVGRVVLDGRTFEPLFALTLGQPKVVVGDGFPYNWHPTNPNWVVMAWGSIMGIIDVRTQKFFRLHRVSGYRHIHFGHHTIGRPDDVTGRIWPIVGEMANGDSEAFLVRFSEDYSSYTISRRIRLQDYGKPSKNKGFILASDGSGALVYGCLTGHRHRHCSAIVSLDPDTLEERWWSLDYHVPGHGDVFLDASGEAWFVGKVKDEVRDAKGRILQDLQRHVVKRSFKTGEIVDLFPGGPRINGSHTSCRAIKAKLCVVSGSGRPITLIDPQTGARRVLADDNRADAGYYSQPHASISPDGSLVAFASNWGDKKNPVVTYVVTTGHRPTGR